MRSVWWSLPGPASALNKALHDLQDGRSVVVAVPLHGSPSPRDRLISCHYPGQWRLLEQERFEEASPSEAVIPQFCPDVPPHKPHDVRSLLDSTRASTLYLSVSINRPAVWSRWRAFLEAIERIGRDTSPLQRPTFLLEVTGPPSAQPLKTGVTVAWHEWRGLSAREDMRAYAAVLGAYRTDPPHVRDVRAAVAAELALWDPELLERLSGWPLPHLLDPLESLLSVAQERGWSETSDQTSAQRWVLGEQELINGTMRWHSAMLALRGRRKELRARVWRGQIAALYPFIEELRLVVAQRLRRKLPKPIRLDGEVVNELAHLEIGELWYLATRPRNKAALPRHLYEGVEVLRRMRNALAHTDPVPSSVLTSPTVTQLARLHSEFFAGA